MMISLKTSSVPFNFVMNFLLKLSGTLCTAISYPYAFRMIGGAGMGRVAFSVSIASFFVMLASMGIPVYGIRECAKVRGDREKLQQTVSELLGLQFLAVIGAEALLCLVTVCVPRLREEWALMLIQACMLLFHGLDTEWLFAALEQYGYLAVRSFVTKLLSVILIFVFVRTPEDYLLYAAFAVVPVILNNIWNIGAVYRRLGGLAKPGSAGIHNHYLYARVFLIQSAAITVYANLDASMLGFFHTDSVVGAYDAVIKIKLVLTYFIVSLGTVLFPRFSYYLAEKRVDEYKRGLLLSAEFVLLTALPLMLFFAILAPECLIVLYGEINRDSLYSLRILAPTLLLIGCSNLTGIQLLTPMGREKVVMKSTVAGAVIDLLANFILIPKFGAAGAALGTLMAEVGVLVYQLAVVRKLDVRLFDIRNAARVVLVSVVASGGLIALHLAEVQPIKTVLLGGILYFGTVYGILMLWGDPVLKLVVLRIRKLR
jgi:O-antigen/teichoic acid export membrane protein